MIHKQLGAIMLVAGTCIGSGMLALPLVLATIGLLPSIILMASNWLLAYYTSLIHLELNLQAGTGLDLGQLAKRFSGPLAQLVSSICLALLMYALLAVYMYGGASLIHTLSTTYTQTDYGFSSIAALYCLLAFCLLLLPIHIIDYVNRLLFIGLLSIVALLITGLCMTTNWLNLPWVTDHTWSLAHWSNVIPVLFTSFGFQVIFHTLTKYCNKNTLVLKRAFFWGSLIPALLYTVWTTTVLGTISNHTPLFYQRMIQGNVQIGSLIQQLSMITQWPLIQILSWIISLLALLTSIIGVGLGLVDSLETMLGSTINQPLLRRTVAAACTILPAYIIATAVPNAFISVLGFAGMILVFIAIIIPLYLLQRLSITHWHYKELRHTWMLWLSLFAGIIIIGSELYNILM